ncbi:MAG: hypothetical protein KKB50_18375 [Planctomycetes bacterium]|nr:hypothetical protein [Planctomycetota bacterium]
MRLSDIQHQERAISIITRALRSGRTHHAYLFAGPEGVGKEQAARALAARLLCAAPDAGGGGLFARAADDDVHDVDACGACASCQLFASDNHPDFHLIHRGLHKLHPERTIRTGKGLFLVVDLIRHFLIEPAATKPSQGRAKVFLIREAERMNEGAQNALLKTLEEPPGNTSLILVTSSAGRLRETIRSRCQLVPFALLPPSYVQEQLAVQAGADVDTARTLAGLAGGRLGVALYWQRCGLLDALGAVTAALQAVPQGDPPSFGSALVETANTLAVRMLSLATGEDANDQAATEGDGPAERGTKAGAKTIPTDDFRAALKLVLMLVAALGRDALLTQAAAPQHLRNMAGQAAAVAALARRVPAGVLEESIRAVSVAEMMLDRNVAPQLACERLAVALQGGIPAT